jgi:hypothetical protein
MREWMREWMRRVGEDSGSTPSTCHFQALGVSEEKLLFILRTPRYVDVKNEFSTRYPDIPPSHA